MAATRNLFFALAPDPAVRRALAHESERLHAAWGGRRVQDDKLHLTLLFLDALPAPLPPPVVSAARVAAEAVSAAPFEVVIDRADCFGRRVAGGVPMRHERYVPHVTALRDPRRPSSHNVAPIRWTIDGFRLMASAEGAYETLGKWALRAGPAVAEDVAP